jgi:hypothetical protein
MNNNFYCNKRFDISFSDFHKLIKVVLPSDYISKETRGIYKQDYMPCNIIEISMKDTETNRQKEDFENKYYIYCWLGQKGLTILADNALTVSLCIEVLKEVKQNPEDYRMLGYKSIDETTLIDNFSKDYLVYKQLNSSNDCSKYVIKELNGDEVQIDFYYNPDSLRLSGALSSLFSLVQLTIEKYQNKAE